jgi:hypothetical protein
VTVVLSRQALHIEADSQYFSGDNGVGMTYNLTWASNIPLIQRLQTGQDDVRVLTARW